MKQAYIYLRDRQIGILRETDDGYSFQYKKEYLVHQILGNSSILMVSWKFRYAFKELFTL